MRKPDRQPILRTDRLRLRPFTMADAPEVQRLAGERQIGDTTGRIPHPYEDGMGEQWIATHRPRYQNGVAVTYAIERRSDGRLIGAVGLEIDAHDAKAELGYWTGKPYWNRGYCTEAAKEVLRFGFGVLGLNRIEARHFTRNPASGRVLQKIGMRHEGHLRQSIRKWDKFEDLELYAVLKSDFEGPS